MSAASNGGPVRPGTAWSDPDEREAFFPGAGSIEGFPGPYNKPKGIRYEQTWELPEFECVPIVDPAELALAKLSPFDQQELLPDPIALSERLPGDGDILKAGPCSLAWLGRELPGGYWEWALADICFVTLYTHWLPASVRYLPARVEL
jgi:hypothetical protein